MRTIVWKQQLNVVEGSIVCFALYVGVDSSFYLIKTVKLYISGLIKSNLDFTFGIIILQLKKNL